MLLTSTLQIFNNLETIAVYDMILSGRAATLRTVANLLKLHDNTGLGFILNTVKCEVKEKQFIKRRDK